MTTGSRGTQPPTDAILDELREVRDPDEDDPDEDDPDEDDPDEDDDDKGGEPALV